MLLQWETLLVLLNIGASLAINKDFAGHFSSNSKQIFLIVNADDYGYSEGISQGILYAAKSGIVTATGILANSPFFERQIELLLSVGGLDKGVHLTLTSGRPLTQNLQAFFSSNDGYFYTNKYKIVASLFAGKIGLPMIRQEWKAQIERCTKAGIKISFINSHEHLHILPRLFDLIDDLSKEYSIPFVRYPTAEWIGSMSASAIIRNVILQVVSVINKNRLNIYDTPKLLGVNPSGHLEINYLMKRLTSLQPGKVYELMCHPGYFREGELRDQHVLGYHDWEGELKALCDLKILSMINTLRIRLCRFSDLVT